MSETVRLHCEAGNHDWDRPRVRGKRPANCPEHQPAEAAPSAVAPGETVTLRCELGDHDWQRPRQKGAKPRNCPEHQPAPTTTATITAVKATQEIDADAVAKMQDEFGVSERIAKAFVLDGSDPPYQWQIDATGFSSADLKAIAKLAVEDDDPSDFEAELPHAA